MCLEHGIILSGIIFTIVKTIDTFQAFQQIGRIFTNDTPRITLIAAAVGQSVFDSFVNQQSILTAFFLAQVFGLNHVVEQFGKWIYNKVFHLSIAHVYRLFKSLVNFSFRNQATEVVIVVKSFLPDIRSIGAKTLFSLCLNHTNGINIQPFLGAVIGFLYHFAVDGHPIVKMTFYPAIGSRCHGVGLSPNGQCCLVIVVFHLVLVQNKGGLSFVAVIARQIAKTLTGIGWFRSGWWSFSNIRRFN